MSGRHLPLLAIALLVACWLEPDRKQQQICAPFEFSAFMFFAWPVLAPWYLFTEAE
jgi:hypothetical protein